MAQITLTLELTPNNVSILCEVLPRLEMRKPYTTEMVSIGNPETNTAEIEKKDTTGKATPTDDKKAETPEKKKSEKTKPATPAKPKAEAPTEKSSISLADVRAVALVLSKAKKQDKLKEIFAKYGAEKLSDISTDDYPALMADLEAANG